MNMNIDIQEEGEDPLARQVRELQAQIAQQQAQHSRQIEELETRIRNIQTSPQPSTSPPSQPVQQPLSPEQANSPQEPARRHKTPPRTMIRPRPIHPDVELYNGENKNDYLSFELKLYTKFEIDQDTYPTETSKTAYAFSRLSGQASRRMLPWLNKHRGTGYTYDAFVAEMRKSFGDPDLQRRSLNRVNNIKQGKRNFDEFLGEFEEVLLNAGGFSWADEVKISLLDSALNRQLVQGMVGRDPAKTYDSYCEQLRRVSNDLDRLNRMDRRRNFIHLSAAPNPRPPQGEAMDWQPSPAIGVVNRGNQQSTGTRRRARWVSADELQKRKDNRACLRCGASSHFVQKCPYAPARRPVVVAATAPDLESEEEEISDEESGKA